MKDYVSLPDLRHIFLEESWVLSIHLAPNNLSIELDFVLMPEHPSYEAPGTQEVHCYRRGIMRFGDVRSLSWNCDAFQPSADATGEMDLGHIHSMAFDGDTYHVDGDIGVLTIRAASCRVELSAA
ncbi:MAG: hypothetical protein U0821_26560 [Chloroflexota bacterium]